VRHLRELAALIRVKVDVVNVQRRRGKAALSHTVADGMGVARVAVVPADVVECVELKVDAHFVVLERNEGERKARVAAEPELEGDI